MKNLILIFMLMAWAFTNANATTFYLKHNNPTQNWNDACNWYTNPLDIANSDCFGVPGFMDSVVINGHSFINLQNNTTIWALSFTGFGTIGGNFEFTVLQSTRLEASCNISTGRANFLGNLNFWGGTVNGTDSAFVHGSTNFHLNAGISKPLVMLGGGNWLSYHISLSTSDGFLINPAGAVFSIHNTAAGVACNYASGGEFKNYGTVIKDTPHNVTFNSPASMTGGEMHLLAGLTTFMNNFPCTDSELNVSDGATLDFNNGARIFTNSSLNSEGYVKMKNTDIFNVGCSLSFDTLYCYGSGGPTFHIPITVPNLIIAGGGAYFNETLTITQSFWWIQGHIYGGSTVICHPQANLVEDGGSSSYTSCKIDFLHGAKWTSGNYVLTAGAEFNFPYGADFLINFNSAGKIEVSGTPYATINLTLESILEKTGTGVATLDVVLNSTESDVFVYGGGLNLWRGTHNDSYFEINSGLAVQCTNVGNYFNNCHITGQGIFRETNFNSNLQSGTTLDCHLEITGGTLTVSSNITPASLKLSGGSLLGTGNINCAGNFNWSGATVFGGNSMLEVNGTTTVSGGAKTFYSKELIVTGGGTWTATGNTAFYSAAKFRIPSGSTFSFAPTANMALVPSTNPDGQLIIEGTLRKTTTAILDLTGEVLANNGRIEGIGKMDTYNSSFVQTNDGAISPGDGIGTLTWGGHFSNAATGSLIFEFEKDPNSGVVSFDQMAFQNNLTLGGTLTVVGADPCWENGTWDIISWSGTRTGSFATVVLPENYSLIIDDVAKKIRISHTIGCQEMRRPTDEVKDAPKPAMEDVNERGMPDASASQDVEFSVFPVPATDVLNVRYTAQPDVSMNLTLVNSTGQQVYSEKAITEGSNQWAMPLQEIPNGLYFLTLQIGTRTSVKRIIVARN
ncbi:MAG: T9SS type A sorting domain-containing protein [Phycisphaerae bacterium]|nr:T9SS type A sorting domain-containing protein [Saprospiraceae bacterium]